ncbi:MAG: efflux RND transporter periplasmic adaptor subunit [Verrucomicrobiota bacterium]
MRLSSLFIPIGLLISAQTLAQSDRSSNTVILNDSGVENLRLELAEVVEQDFETTVFAIGRIEEIPANRSVLSSRIAGRVIELNVFVGDVVEQDQALAKVESRQLGDPPPTISLRAPQQGLIVDSHVRLGQPVEPAQELLDIADYSKLWAVARIPEREAAFIDIGSRARIRIPAFGDEVFEAKLTRFGVQADRDAGTIEGIFELDNSTGKLRPGMRAEFSIITRLREGVMAVPREAVQGDPANRFVFVKDFELLNAFVRCPVILGEQNDQYVEIVSGVFPGDEVVTNGSYALSFVGGNSGMSLKEALDAAHGHEHNEDGSEITSEQRAERERHKHDEAGGHGETGELEIPLLVYALVVTALLLIACQQLWRRRNSSQGRDVE